MIVRRAVPGDADGINGVYNPFITDTATTFETTPINETKRRAWLSELSGDERSPVFVAEGDHQDICGFANAAPFDPRPAYGTSVKTSVFIKPGLQGRGIGKALYTALFDVLAGLDIHRAYALIVAPNPGSVALHEAFGFAHVATLDEVGRKFDSYHSVMWFEKRL